MAEAQTEARRLLAGGLSERAVAERLHVSPSTVHRLKVAADAAQAAATATPAADQEQMDVAATPESAEPVPGLSALRSRLDQLAAQHGALLDQAKAAREAVEDSDSRRLDALANGGDSSRLAAERAKYEAEYIRLAADAAVVGGWFEECEAEIDRREAEREGDTGRVALAGDCLVACGEGRADGRGPGRPCRPRRPVGRQGREQFAREAAQWDERNRLAQAEASAGRRGYNMGGPIMMPDRNQVTGYERVAANIDMQGGYRDVPPSPLTPLGERLRPAG